MRLLDGQFQVKHVRSFHWSSVHIRLLALTVFFTRVLEYVRTVRSLLCFYEFYKTSYTAISSILLQTVSGIASLFVHRNLWRYIEGGGKSKCRIIGNFSSQILMGAKWGWFYIRVWLYLQKESPWFLGGSLIYEYRERFRSGCEGQEGE
jgi:hypothetical protein